MKALKKFALSLIKTDIRDWVKGRALRVPADKVNDLVWKATNKIAAVAGIKGDSLKLLIASAISTGYDELQNEAQELALKEIEKLLK